MGTYIVRRLLILPVSLFLLILFSFSIIHLTPGDPAAILLGEFATQDQIDALREELGFNKPIHVQFYEWFGKILTGDFGRSLIMKESVVEILIRRIPRTAWLALFATVVSAIFGIPFGVYAALNRDTFLDRIFMVLTTSFMSIPIFVLALNAMLVFAVKLQWLPVAGYVSPLEDPVNGFKHLLLPSLSISSMSMAYLARMARSAMLETMRQEYVTTARSKGLAERKVIWKHIFRPASIPVVTSLGMILGGLLGGTIISETIFVIPGIGKLMYDAVLWRDYIILQALIVFVGTTYYLINLIVDILYAYINPQISYD
jgi:peptide/nickel transport system permease protein